MALNGWSSKIVLAVLALLLIPAQHYLPGLLHGPDGDEPSHRAAKSESSPPGAPGVRSPFDFSSDNVTYLEIFITTMLLVLGVLIYICEWIQGKIKERRITKLRHFLTLNLGLLDAWDVQQQQLESRLLMVQNATTEYNLFLYLLMNKNRSFDNTPTS